MRQQIRWLWFGMATSLVPMVLVTATVGTGATLAAEQVDRHMTGHLLLVFAGAIFPSSVSAAWLLSAQPDPDTLIRRTFVYGALTSIVVFGSICLVVVPAFFYEELGAVYVLVIVCAWAVTGLPLQQFLQRTINRLLYGQRDDPIAVLNSLGQRLELGSPETVLETIVETVATTLKLPAAAILPPGEGQPLASVGTFELEPVSIPIVHQGVQVGVLAVSPRARDEPLQEQDHDVLRLVARQAAPTVRAVQLNHELRRSRQQIVTGREEERRRIRRDLHDGLGPALASIAMQADTARAVVTEDPETARQLLIAVTQQAEDVVHEVRRLVYELRPPALDELGLVGAIERLARQGQSATLAIHVEADALPPMGAAVEVAVYRIVAEALTNVGRHANATCAAVILRLTGSQLAVTIEDDGGGLAAPVSQGIGLQSIRDRAGELGGRVSIESSPGKGTTVRLQLPLPGAVGERE